MALTKLEIRLEAETTRLQKDLDKANRKVKRWAKRSSKAAKSVNQAFKRIGVGAALAAGAIGLLVKNSLEAGDVLAKTADKLGTTTKKLAGLQHAAEITGVAQATLNKALTKQQKAIFDADRGLLTYSQHFDKLGLSTKKLMALDPVDQFKAIGEALANVKNQTDKTAIAYDVFGGRGTALLNTLALGKKGLEDIAKEAEVLGIALNRVDTAKMEEANDTFVRMKGVVKGVSNSLTISLAPILDGLGKMFVDAAKESGGMVEFISKGMNKIIGAVGFVADAFHGLKVVWKGLEVAFAWTANVIVEILNFILIPFKTLLKGLSKFSDTAGEALMAIEDLSLTTMRNLIDKQAEFNAILAEPPPSEGIRQWVDEVIVESQRLAEEKAELVAASQQSTIDAELLTAKQRIAINKKAEKTIASFKKDTAKTALGILSVLGQKSKAFAVAALIVEKAMAIQRIIAQSRVAAMAALTPPPIGLGPVAGQGLAASIEAAGSASALAVGALGAIQLGGLATEGESGYEAPAIGAPGDLTDIPSQSSFDSVRNINITIEGGVADRDTAERIAESLRDLFNDGGRQFT